MERLTARDSALRWAVSLALLLPVIALYVCEYARNGAFTGFLQYDQASYMADARKFFDGGFHLFYGNPFSPDPATPRIYFQVHLFVLGAIGKVTGWDPGAIYVAFGFFAALVCVRVAMALYEQIAGLRTPAERTGLVLFIWGGGILELMGAAAGHLFRFDPDDGWWFLNLGRNLVFPTEAYYHALALGAVLLALRRRFRGALALGFLLLLSHPFTGFQFLLILFVWAAFESIVAGNREVPLLFAAAMGSLLALHVLYYVVLLNQFAEHRAVFLQWSLAWNERAATALGADLLVGLLAFGAMRRWALARTFLSSSANRLLAIWFLVSLLLAHHDLLFDARQPLHFTRGYTWIALFLLGAQPLKRLLESAFARTLGWRSLALGLILGLGLSDNVIWFGAQIAETGSPSGSALALGASERDLFHWLNKRAEPHAELLISTNPGSTLTYLATVYTDYRGGFTHFASTPFAVRRRQEVIDFVQTGRESPDWAGKSLLLIANRIDGHGTVPWGEPVFENADFRVYRVQFP